MKRSWQEKYDEILKRFPSIEGTDWGSSFRRDSDLFTTILSDLLKAEGRGSRPGKRPSLSKSEAVNQLARIAQSDFSDTDFYTTFTALVGNRSVRSVANKTGLGKSYVYQLLNKERVPSFSTMEKIAIGFKKDPSFFLEYRVAYILCHLDTFLLDSPEIATNWFLKLKKLNNSTIRIK